MKYNFQAVFALLVLILMSLAPASAYGAGARTHSVTYHNHTPRAHTHGSHARRG